MRQTGPGIATSALTTACAFAVLSLHWLGSARTTTVEIFGRPMDLPSGPAALARAAGVALLPVFVFRRGRHHSRLVFRPPIRVTGRGDDALAEAVRRIGGDVEWAIRREPHQWFCFRELWP